MFLEGIPAHTCTFIVSTMGTFLRRVLDRWGTDPAAHVRCRAVQHYLTVKWNSEVNAWRTRAFCCPGALVRAMVGAHASGRDALVGMQMHRYRVICWLVFDSSCWSSRRSPWLLYWR